MKGLKILLIAVLLFSFSGLRFYETADAATSTSGIIRENTTWTKANSPYDLTGDVQVAYGTTLTIEPGVVVRGGKIRVFGTLNAVGTKAEMVEFEGVQIEGAGSTRQTPHNIQMSFVKIKEGSFYAATGYANYGSFSLTDSIIKGLLDSMYLWYPTSDVTIARNAFIKTSGINTMTSSHNVHIQNNIFYQIDGGTAISNSNANTNAITYIEKNTFIDTTIQLQKGYRDTAMVATNNYWGTDNESIISSYIFDKEDDLDRASVIPFKPFLTKPDPATPVLDVTPPKAPVVAAVTDKSEKITGTTEPNASVTIWTYFGTNELKTKADANGAFEFSISPQEADSSITIKVEDDWMNSTYGEIIVKDGKAPEKPTLNKLTDADTVISGGGERNVKAEAFVGTTRIGQGTVDDMDMFSFTIAKQALGTTVTVVLTDAAGNKSEAGSIVVTDGTAPEAPKVNEVTEKSTTITGTAEKGSTVTAKVGSTTIGTTTAGTDGTFSMTVAAQKGNASVSVTATDKSGNVSKATTVTVKDLTAPVKPTVNTLNDASTTLTGKGEASTKVEAFSGTTKIGQGTVSAGGDFSFTVTKQAAGTTVTVVLIDAAGNKSEAGSIVVTDGTAPDAPTVREVTDKATTITGTAEKGATVTAKVGSTTIGTATAGTDGAYSITIAAQKANATVSVTATDKSGNVGKAASVTVKDVTAPVKPTVNTVNDASTTLTGKGEANAKVEAFSGTTRIGQGTVSAGGDFSLTITKQGAGTTVTVVLIDATGNKSETGSITVTDGTAPDAPTVREVTDKATTITGTAEKGATVTAKVGSSTIGTATAGTDGTFSMTVATQKADATVSVTATDKSGNVSKAASVTVKDVTAPVKPTVNTLNDASTTLTGKGEANAKVEAFSGTTRIGQGTVSAGGDFSFTVTKQTAGTTVTVVLIDAMGNKSEAGSVLVTDVTAPDIPRVNDITEKSMFLSGVAEKDAIVTAKVGSTTIGTAKAESTGMFSMIIATQKANVSITVTATDRSGNISKIATVIVKDVTPPDAPTVHEVTDKVKTITGKAEKGSVVTAKIGSLTIGTATAGMDGSYSMPIPMQKANVSIDVTATDTSGNKSKATTVSVKDMTAPFKPVISTLADSSSTLTGKGEADAKVEVYAGTTKIGQGTVLSSGDFSVTVPKQEAGTLVTVLVIDAAGNKSEAGSIIVIDVTAPDAPVVSEVSDKATNITGTAEEGSTVTAKVGSTILATSTAGSDGAFFMTIDAQKANTTISVTAMDKSGNLSQALAIVVKDATAPLKPTVDPLTDASTTITGKGEANAKVEAYSGTTIIGQGTVSSGGDFSIAITKQAAGTTVLVVLIDAAGNKSEAGATAVIDKTPPASPKVNSINDNTEKLTGTAEPGSKIDVYNGKKLIGTTTSDKKSGLYTVKITKQKAGTKMSVFAIDGSENRSKASTVTVLDKTPPPAPKVNALADNAVTLTGTAEAAAKVEVFNGKKVIGSATADKKSGKFSIKLPKQKAGTKLTIIATDSAKNKSKATAITVQDKTPPAAPTISAVKATTTSVTGKAEAGATVYLYNGKTKLAQATADAKGNYKMTIKKQKKSAKLTVYATDKAKNKSKVITITVK